MFARNGAYISLECDLEDHGDVLWRLNVPTDGFPFGEQGGGGTCILREQHRQVLFVAFAWLIKNAETLALTDKNRGNVPPAAVAAVCGSTGIGKSRSLIFLMWFLLQRKWAFCSRPATKSYALARPREQTVRILSEFDDVHRTLRIDRSIICIGDPDNNVSLPVLAMGTFPAIKFHN